jgi:cellobiose-specific phosphotransferase system component IIC
LWRRVDVQQITLAIAGMVFAFAKGKTMSKSKQLAHLLVCAGAVFFFWALASRAIHSETVTFRVSPAGGFEFKAEGSQK